MGVDLLLALMTLLNLLCQTNLRPHMMSYHLLLILLGLSLMLSFPHVFTSLKASGFSFLVSYYPFHLS